jgi:hypothetical protein
MRFFAFGISKRMRKEVKYPYPETSILTVQQIVVTLIRNLLLVSNLSERVTVRILKT